MSTDSVMPSKHLILCRPLLLSPSVFLSINIWCCWCWEGLGAGGKGDDRGWVGWMASWTRCTWVFVNSGSWWWTGRPGVLQFMGLQRIWHDWVTELNWLIIPVGSAPWHYWWYLSFDGNYGTKLIFTGELLSHNHLFWTCDYLWDGFFNLYFM